MREKENTRQREELVGRLPPPIYIENGKMQNQIRLVSRGRSPRVLKETG
jgi:hypothetical protein